MLIRPEYLKRYWAMLLCGAVTMVVIVYFGTLGMGAVPIDFTEVISLSLGDSSSLHYMILWELRVPRCTLALLVGATLSTCGAVSQGLFRNSLADPSLIGVSAGAMAGASCVIVLLNHTQWSLSGLSLVSIGAFIGAVLAVLLVYRIATGSNGTSVATMLLAGIAVAFLAGSVASILEFVADNEMLRRISLWGMGSFDAANNLRVGIMAVITIGIFILIPYFYPALNALLLGESEARHLGIEVDKVKKVMVVTIAAGVGVSVALVGTISFVGLVVPHIVRVLVGPNHRYVIPLSACLGAMLLVIADAVARTLIAPTEIPVGLVTSLIGAPLFIFLLKHQYTSRGHVA